MKLKTKIHLFSTILMLIILVLTNTGIYFLFEKMAYDTERDQLQIQSEDIIKSFSKMTEQTDPDTVVRAHLFRDGAIRVVDEAGKSKTSGELAAGLKDFAPSFKKDARYSIEKYEGVPVLSLRMPVIWINGEVVELQVIQKLGDVAHNLTTLMFVLAGVTLVAMIPILISSIALARILIQPIERLIATMSQSRQAGTYEKISLPAKGKDEMAQMTITFNDMMEQLEQNFIQQEEFVSNASHELKTPLTVIESYARLLTRHGFDNRDVAEEAIGAILGESVRMKEMIEQLLQLARNHEQLAFDFVETDLHDQIEKTLQPMRQAYAREFTFEGNSNAVVMTDGEKFRQLLYILLDNARKYSEERIRITMEESEEGYSISIIDYGNGIPEEALPHIFTRFYRVEEDRSRKTGGTGLGLAIAKELADGLEIRLKIESISGMGTTIRLFVPKKQTWREESTLS